MDTAMSTDTQNKSKQFEDLIGPTDPRVDREAREKMITARIGLLLRASFFGNLATRLVLRNADDWCGTAATDGRYFYYNSRFINKLRAKELEFLFGHEVLHVVYDHLGRRGDRDPQMWNVAGDYRNNADLKRHGIGEFITTVPALYDAKYDGMITEEIYDDIMSNAEVMDINKLAERLLDEHLKGSGGSDGGDGQNNGSGPVPMTEEERARLRDEIKEAVLNAANSCDNAGQIPLGVRRLIKDMTEPKMNWRDLIRQDIKSLLRSDFTFMKTNRKGWHLDAIMPGMDYDEMVELMVFIDVSGSISETQARDFISEVKGIMEEFPQYRIHLGCFDTQVYNVKVFDNENLEDIMDYEILGGGGTDFECMYSYMKDQEIEPKKLVVFTDGYPFGSWGDENYCDTLWIIHGDKNPNPPFGQWALYEP